MQHIAGIFIPLILILLSGYVIWKSTDAFEAAADFLGRKMSRGVKGATINAVASSMPEFLTTLFFLFTIENEGEFVDSFSGGLGVVAGSAVFNILIIPLAVILFGSAKLAPKVFHIDRKVVQRDGLFLVISNIAFIVIISQERIGKLSALILLGIYLIYLFILKGGLGMGVKEPDHGDRYIFPPEKIRFTDYLTLQLKRILLSGKKLNTGYAWYTLLLTTFFMSIGTLLLVKGTEMLGENEYKLFEGSGMEVVLYGLNLPIIFLSVLLAAAATSIPDTMISIRDARKGNHDDSISNAIGSNIFDLSFALGLPLLLYTLVYDGFSMSAETRTLSVSYWLLMWLINLVVIPIFIYSKRISRRTGIVLLIIYAVFILEIMDVQFMEIDYLQKLANAVIERVNF
jgi:cation:H+ antiporter